jgi:hypothetical protein
VDPLTDVQVEVFTPPGITAADLELLVDGVYRGEAFSPLPDSTGRRWTATALGPWEPARHVITVRFLDTGAEVSTIGFEVRNDLAVLQTYAYPNPYEEASPGPENPLYFVYDLSRDGSRAELQVFTVRGRRVLRRDVTAYTGRNAFRWDLRDEAGDPVANGVYLFRLRVYGEGDARLDRLERVAVAR